MQQLMSFFFEPKRTIQLYAHQKQWRIWWLFIGIYALLAAIKNSNLSVLGLSLYGVTWLMWLMIGALVVDSAAQLMGLEGQLKNTLYWHGFSNTLMWLFPLASIIQSRMYAVGSFIHLGLVAAYIYYLWVTFRQIYGMTKWQLTGLFIFPVLSMIALLFIGVIMIVQQLALFQ